MISFRSSVRRICRLSSAPSSKGTTVPDEPTPFESDEVAVPPIAAMLIPDPFPTATGVGHLGLELWVHAARFAPQHLSEIPDPEQHFQNLHLEWMTQIRDAEHNVGRHDLAAIDEAELKIRRARPWASPELAHPIWDGTSDRDEAEQQLIPAVALPTLNQYRQLRQAPLSDLLAELDGEALALAVMLVEKNGSSVLDKIEKHRTGPPTTGTPTS